MRFFKLFFSLLMVVIVFFNGSAPGFTISQSALESIINNRPFYNRAATSICSPGNSSPTTNSGDPAQQIFDYFVANGFTKEQAAAVAGNIQQESSFNPKTGEGGSHIGLAQWDSVSRWPKYLAWAKLNGKDPWDFTTQKEYILVEFTSDYAGVLDKFKQETTIEGATKVFLDGFEGASGQQLSERISYARDIFAKYAGGSTGDSKVTPPGTGEAGINGPNVNPLVRFKYGNGPRLKTGLPPGADVSREDWAKLLLKFIAVGSGAKESDVITEEKVKAVVAWGIIEGGSSSTPGAYNVLNVAKDSAQYQGDLNPIYNHVYADGNQHPAFKTLEEGVESNARFIEKNHYSRLLEMLLDPSMTADKFVENFDNKTYNGATGQMTWAAGGYLTQFGSTVRGFDNSAARDRRYSQSILDPEGKAALIALGVTPSDGISPLDINATTGGGSANCSNDTISRVGNLLYPLVTTRSAVEKSLGGCLDKASQTICKGGHPYTAYDLLTTEGTEVVAAKEGVVLKAGTASCGHGFGNAFSVQVYNKGEDRTYFYQHMDASSGQVTKGDEVTAGTPLGKVGGSEADCNTTPHLHIDAVSGSGRPACSRLSCPDDFKSRFTDLSKELYSAYTGLP